MEFKKIWTLCLLMLLIFSMATTSFGYSSENMETICSKSLVQPRYVCLNLFNVNMSTSGQTVTGTVTLQSDYGTTANYTMYLEKSSDKENWTVASVLYSGKVENGEAGGITKSKTVSSGFYYRIRVSVSVYEGNILRETPERSSSSKWI